jgi:hypothetical protein
MQKINAVRPMALLLAAVAITASSCDKKMNNSWGPSDAPIGLRIEGATTFTGPGQVQQLVAIATYANGDEHSLTSGVTWVSSRTSVATVTSAGPTDGSAPGTLTTVGLGTTVIRALANNGRLRDDATVVVTPPGTFAVGGRVREPGAGDLTGVLVEDGAGTNQTTSTQGDFTLGGLTPGQLHFTMAGYETVDEAVATGTELDVPMQRVLALTPGGTVSALLAPNDLSYEVRPGVYSQPCRRVRMTSSSAGTVDLHLAWSASGATLHLWVDGLEYAPSDVAAHELNLTLPVQPGEQLIYVTGKIGLQHVPWSLTASDVR